MKKIYILLISTLICTIGIGQDEELPLFSCEDGTKKAIIDAQNGKFEIYNFGLLLSSDSDFDKFYANYLFEKYGIEDTHQGCEVYKYLECYSDKMLQLIYEKFGPDIFDRAKIEAKAKYKISLKEKIDTGFVFTNVDKKPGFVGGSDSLRAYLTSKLQVPETIKGKVMISFIVETSGILTNVRIRRGINKDFDKEIIQIFSQMPAWSVGEIMGQAVRTKLNLHLSFHL